MALEHKKWPGFDNRWTDDKKQDYKDNYVPYLKWVRKQNKERAKDKLPPLDILPYDDKQQKLFDKHREKNNLPITEQHEEKYEKWPTYKLDGQDYLPMYRNQYTGHFALPSNTLQEQDARRQRIEYLFECLDAGYRLRKRDFRLMNLHYGTRIFNPEICERLLEASQKWATWPAIWHEINITPTIHRTWIRNEPMYRGAAERAEVNMYGIQSKKFQKDHENKKIPAAAWIKVLERMEAGKWADPRNKEQENNGNAFAALVVTTHPNFKIPQSMVQNKPVEENDPSWTDRELLNDTRAIQSQ